uniref:Sorcin n=1 Tax=Schistosoma japonicum TaxID=6182 RepID=C1LKZ9_SCHJA|nr:Sorcin [Schistosoma japonicum]
MVMDTNSLRHIFSRVDADKSGSISANELQTSLSNGLGTPFNIRTVQLMVAMFDRDMNGTINFNEFCSLFKYVQDWQTCFRRYDRDNSGSIDLNEFSNALISFGYHLSPQFVNLMMRRFDRNRRGFIAFDDFIYACVCLQTLTGEFGRYDCRGIGHTVFSFEQFLTSAFAVII